jgi:hypothetical protein
LSWTSNTIFWTILRVRPFIISHFCQTCRRPFQRSAHFRTPFPSGDRNPLDTSSSSKHKPFNPTGTTLQWLTAPSSMRVGGVIALNFPSDVFGETRLRTDRAIACVLSTLHGPRIEQIVIRLRFRSRKGDKGRHFTRSNFGQCDLVCDARAGILFIHLISVL